MGAIGGNTEVCEPAEANAVAALAALLTYGFVPTRSEWFHGPVSSGVDPPEIGCTDASPPDRTEERRVARTGAGPVACSLSFAFSSVRTRVWRA